jgi:hypothetical protein
MEVVPDLTGGALWREAGKDLAHVQGVYPTSFVAGPYILGFFISPLASIPPPPRRMPNLHRDKTKVGVRRKRFFFYNV